MSRKKWVDVATKLPSAEGYYTVYIDQTASNTPDTIQTGYWNGKDWDRLGREQKVTHWRPRVKPPLGSWMDKQ